MVPKLNSTPVRVLRSRMAVSVCGDQAVTLFPLTPARDWHAPFPLCRHFRGPSVQEPRPLSASGEHAVRIPPASQQPEPYIPPDLIIPLRLQGTGRQPGNTRPREHGGTLKVGQTGLTARARELPPHRPSTLASAVSLILVSSEASGSLAPHTSCCQF